MQLKRVEENKETGEDQESASTVRPKPQINLTLGLRYARTLHHKERLDENRSLRDALLGKTTLIDEFLRAHPDFAHEPEPYITLVEDFGEEFSSEPCADDFYRQLEFNVDRLRRHSRGERVIYERSPVDFLAYILTLKDLNRHDVDSGLVKAALGLVLDGIRNLI